MATYTGNPTATQAPGPQPAPETFPINTLVVDGTVINAASVNQQFKESPDFIAWLQQPRAQAAAGSGTSHWGDPLFRYRSSQLHTRFAIDHFGFPAGQILQWDENWDDLGINVPGATANATGQLGSRWRYRTVTAGTFLLGAEGAVRVGATRAYPSGHAYMQNQAVGGPSDQLTYFERAFAPMAIESAGGVVASLIWDQTFYDNSGSIESAIGMLTGGSLLGGSTTVLFGSGAAQNAPGVAFVSQSGTWHAYVNAVSSVTYTDTTIAVAALGTRTRFRIDVIGAGVSDDATARILFWVNGVLGASTAVDITNGGVGVSFLPFIRLWSNSALTTQLVGPMKFRANLWNSDVLI